VKRLVFLAYVATKQGIAAACHAVIDLFPIVGGILLSNPL